MNLETLQYMISNLSNEDIEDIQKSRQETERGENITFKDVEYVEPKYIFLRVFGGKGVFCANTLNYWTEKEFKNFMLGKIESCQSVIREFKRIEETATHEYPFELSENTKEFIAGRTESLQEEIKKINTLLAQLIIPTDNIKQRYLDINQARQVPIENFIQFNRAGFATSIWNPLEKTPSMRYRKNINRVHCFSTGKNGDVIDVVMVMRGVGFKEALKILLNK